VARAFREVLMGSQTCHIHRCRSTSSDLPSNTLRALYLCHFNPTSVSSGPRCQQRACVRACVHHHFNFARLHFVWALLSTTRMCVRAFISHFNGPCC
jgi:hypothetical protein